MCHLTKQLNCKHTVHLTNLIDASCCHGDVGMLHIDAMVGGCMPLLPDCSDQ